ncbi:hypothetical protein [uncultured Rothia sp.]|uniref:hypothetical protein n=1 Tax=uncultured Rothia sp. TaxID=316088 RepID=UPI003216C64C
MKTPENSAGGEDFADEPLDLNPWEANDPKGLSGRPDAEPSPPGIRKMRWVVVTFVVVNVLGFFYRAASGRLGFRGDHDSSIPPDSTAIFYAGDGQNG